MIKHLRTLLITALLGLAFTAQAQAPRFVILNESGELNSSVTNLFSANTNLLVGALDQYFPTLDSLSTVATTGAYSDLSGTPTLGTAAAANIGTGADQVAAGDHGHAISGVIGLQDALDGKLATDADLPAAQITGTIADGRLSSNIPRFDAATWTFPGNLIGGAASFTEGVFGEFYADVFTTPALTATNLLFPAKTTPATPSAGILHMFSNSADQDKPYAINSAGTVWDLTEGGDALPSSTTNGEILRGNGAAYEPFNLGLFQGAGNTTNGVTTASFSTNSIPDNHIATFKFLAHVGEWTNNYAEFEGRFTARNHSGTIITNTATIDETDAADLYNLTMAVAGTNIVFGGSTTSTNDAQWLFRVTDTLISPLGVETETDEVSTLYDGLEAFWTLDGNLNDTSGNSLNLSNYDEAVSYAAGDSALHVYYVDNTDNSGAVRPGGDTGLQVRSGESFTAAAKITINDPLPGANLPLFGVMTATSSDSEWFVRLGSDNQFEAVAVTTGSSVVVRDVSAVTAVAGQEYDVILRFNNDTDGLFLYVDDSSSSTTFSSDGFKNTSHPFNLRAVTVVWEAGFEIRNLGAWKRALTGPERAEWRGGWTP